MNIQSIIILLASLTALTSAILPGIDKTRAFSDRDLVILIKRKYENLPDYYLDDDYYKTDIEFLRSSSQNCVFNKLNLIDVDDVTMDELKNFDPITAIGDEQEDVNTMVIYVMYSCIEDANEFIDHDFANFIKKPRHPIPQNSTECAKFELTKLNKNKPLIDSYPSLKNFTKKQCNKILKDLKTVNKSNDDDFRGCLKIYDNSSLEYELKFAIMNHEMPNEKTYNEEKEKYGRESTIVNNEFVDCMIKRIL
ncbi:hypothetical protein ACKWTF_014800 [Chironomus riparius]